MINRRTVLAGAVALVPAAALADVLTIPPHPAAGPVDDVKALLDASAQEWSAGDVVAFCAHYHDDAVFVSPSGLTRGRQAVLDRYQKKYVDKAAMGALSFELLDVLAGADAASVAMKWKLSYPKKTAAEGYSVIGLVKNGLVKSGPWLIKHDASM